MKDHFDLITINTDGGSRGNPGPAAIGVYAQAGGKVLFTISERIGEDTNNVAEYTAVIRALEKLISDKLTSEKVKFILDSELIVRQITGIYKIKAPHLKELQKKVSLLVKEGREKKIINLMAFTNVLREENKEADKLVNEALDN